MRRVILESPFGSEEPLIIARNIRYARLCAHDCIVNHDESPFGSHLIYTQPGVLNDHDAEERKKGIEAGFEWMSVAEAVVIYTDFGISSGMQKGIERAEEFGLPTEKRTLPAHLMAKLKNGGDISDASVWAWA